MQRVDLRWSVTPVYVKQRRRGQEHVGLEEAVVDSDREGCWQWWHYLLVLADEHAVKETDLCFVLRVVDERQV